MIAKAYSRSIPVPVGGWNARDPLEDMADTDAVRLVNFIPRNGRIELRKGSRVHTPSGLGTGAVSTLTEHCGADGTRKLLAAANGNIFDVSTFDGAATDLSGSFGAFTSNYWQTTLFKGTTIFVNGADQPKKFDGTTLTDATYTGIADDADLISVNVYKQSLYFVEKDTLSAWYGVTGEITGALTEFNVSDFCRRGGYLVFAGSFTRDTGQGYQDLFVMVTNMGEILIYEGLSPADTAWGLVGHYYIPTPLGRRACFNHNADLVILTEAGAIPLSRMLAGVDPSSEEAYVTDKIRGAFRDAATLYGTNTGWEALPYPRGEFVLFNIPIATNSQAEQYVVNLHTGAWCKFVGMNAVCWSLFNNKLYFGGTNGKVYQADYETTDNGADIEYEIKPAFNYFGNRAQEKLFTLARPIVTSDAMITFGCVADVDFQDRAVTDTITVTGAGGSEWDESDWDSSEWGVGSLVSEEWYALGDMGRCASIKMKGVARNVNFSISAIDVIYETGGFI